MEQDYSFKMCTIRALASEATITSGDRAGCVVFIPRITLQPCDDFGFQWQRRQFPVRIAYAMTINKAQGQTLKRVGVWLNEPVFTHGQLYVAASHVGHPANVCFAQYDIANSYNHIWNGLTRVVYNDAGGGRETTITFGMALCAERNAVPHSRLIDAWG